MKKTHKNTKLKKTLKKQLENPKKVSNNKPNKNDKEKLEAIKEILSKAYNPYSKLNNIKKIIFS